MSAQPSMNGAHLDLHTAAQALYAELRGLPWFVAVVIDQGRIVVEVRDLDAGRAWFEHKGAHGWPVDVQRGKAAAYRPVKVVVPEEGGEMCS